MGVHRQASTERYERIQRQVAAWQAVDAAEDVLGHAWVEQLAGIRQEAGTAVCVAGETVAAARSLLHVAESDGDAEQFACARALLARSERELAQTLADTRRILAGVEEELRVLERATAERMRRRRSDARLLCTARAATMRSDPDHDAEK